MKSIGNGRIIHNNSRKLTAWRGSVVAATLERLDGQRDVRFDGPVQVTIQFRLPRPKHHLRTGKYAGELKPGAPVYPFGRPDLDKLIRAVLDALTDADRVWIDDAQVVAVTAMKFYANGDGATGAHITVESLQVLVT